MPNRFLGIVGNHNNFPIQQMSLSSDGNFLASISHDETVRIWNVEHVKNMRVNVQAKKVKSKALKDKKITTKGKSENFFEDLIDNEEENEDDDQDTSDDEDEEDDEDDNENESDDEEDDETDEESEKT
jgi:WD repeat-containing protein 55